MNGREAAESAGISYWSLDRWVRRGILNPTGRGRRGFDRYFSPRDILHVKIAGTLRDYGVGLDDMTGAIQAIEAIFDEWKELYASD